MATPNSPIRLKTAGDLQIWLGQLGERATTAVQLAAHGGTALTLLGLKESTKDVDFSFRTREDFDHMVRTLWQAGYKETWQFRPNAREIQMRFENSDSLIDVIDLRFPTWNRWRLTANVLRNAHSIPYGRLNLILPDRDVIFLFKTYPLRDSDLDDLRGIVDRTSPDQSRIINLFDEQDRICREELEKQDLEYEPLIDILNLRTRYAGSFLLIGQTYRNRLKRLVGHSRKKLRELDLGISLKAIVQELRDPDGVEDWDKMLGERMEPLRTKMKLEAPQRMSP